MTEREWQECADPQKMLEFLRESGKLSERKARLFACACVRHIWWSHLSAECSQKAVEIAELYADGQATWSDTFWSSEKAGTVYHALSVDAEEKELLGPEELSKVWATCMSVWVGLTAINAAFASIRLANSEERKKQVLLLQDIFGYWPGNAQAIIGPAILAWNDEQVVRVAESVYQDRFLDPSRLAILADALENAGSNDLDLLGHLRGQHYHVRGCWAVDLCLGKTLGDAP